MHFDESIRRYLTGEQLSTALSVRLFGKNAVEANRIDFLTNLASGKKILHIGFTDHLEVIENKLASNQWLHALLAQRATRCAGIDINRETVNFCRLRLKISDIYCHDITHEEPLSTILEDSWDYAILGEVLEHLSDPVAFLTAFRRKYGSCVNRIVITVPNAWELGNFFLACRRTEFINSDHRFWFTPYTLAKIAADSGFSPEHFYYTHIPRSESFVFRWIRMRYPLLRDTLIGIFICSSALYDKTVDLPHQN